MRKVFFSCLLLLFLPLVCADALARVSHTPSEEIAALPREFGSQREGEKCGLVAQEASFSNAGEPSPSESQNPSGECGIEMLCRALEVAAFLDKQAAQRFPATYNYLLATGYFATHSARMTEEGYAGIGYAYAAPYIQLNARAQPFSFLELTLDYRIFHGVLDPSLSKFGDYADRGGNVKFSILTPEWSDYQLPGLAIGMDDFFGSKKFTAYYLVGTYIFPDCGLECSAGWGTGLRYQQGPSRGFFGGINWFPLYEVCNRWAGGFCLSAEYDPTNYANDPHEFGRITHTPLNFGAKYRIGDIAEFSASYMRGVAWAGSLSVHYNWGHSCGFFPKTKDPPLYTTPVDREPLGCYRPTYFMIHDLGYALAEQGFQLTGAWMGYTSCEKKRLQGNALWLRMINCSYRQEEVVRLRLQCLLGALLPANIDLVVVQLESFGLLCQQYVFRKDFLLRYVTHTVTPFECDIVSPREEACPSPPADPLFRRRYDLWRATLVPRTFNFFGSTAGKYKYSLGVGVRGSGFLPQNWFYEVQVSTTCASNLHEVGDHDPWRPSPLPVVQTDYVNYRCSYALCWDCLYLQKSWNLGRGYFSRAAAGYFTANYAGVAGEALWYPAHSLCAIGVEGAILKKRRYVGVGFQSKLRYYTEPFGPPTFRPYTFLEQYFLNFYLDMPAIKMFTKISAGQFLAADKGVRTELTRYFRNGIRLIGWMTFTNAHEVINGQRYYDKGVALEFPMDLVSRCSSRKIDYEGIAAWFRDAGCMMWTGRQLFETLNGERRW